MAKTPQLPHTDFANYAMMPLARREMVLLNHSTFVPRYTLRAFKKSLTEICNVRSGMFRFEHTPWETVRRHVENHSKSYPKSRDLCIEVSKALWEHVEDEQIFAEERIIERVALGGGWSVQYWEDFYFVRDGKLLSPYFDGRKGNTRMTPDGALFACSLSKHFLARGRFRDLVPCVYQFPPLKEARRVDVMMFDESDLLPITELEQRVTETHDLWNWVLRRRAA